MIRNQSCLSRLRSTVRCFRQVSHQQFCVSTQTTADYANPKEKAPEDAGEEDLGPYVTRKVKYANARKYEVVTLFGRKHDIQTHQLRALLNYSRLDYIYYECDPTRTQEWGIHPDPPETLTYPLLQVCRIDNLRHLQTNVRHKLMDYVPAASKSVIAKAPSMHILTAAENLCLPPVQNDQKKFMETVEELYKIVCTEAVQGDNLYFFGTYAVRDFVEFLCQAKRVDRNRFASTKALQKSQWAEEQLGPLTELCTVASIWKCFQRYMYIMKFKQLSYFRREILHHGLGLYARFVVRRRLRKITGRRNYVRVDLYDWLENLLEEIQPFNFIGGVEPNLADIMVYGVLESINDLDIGNGVYKKVEKLDAYYDRLLDEIGDDRCLENVMIGETIIRPKMICNNFFRNLDRL